MRVAVLADIHGNALALAHPGSVGGLAYADPGHVPPHVSEAGTPFNSVTYAWEESASRAEEHGRADWAHALRIGTMPKAQDD